MKGPSGRAKVVMQFGATLCVIASAQLYRWLSAQLPPVLPTDAEQRSWQELLFLCTIRALPWLGILLPWAVMFTCVQIYCSRLDVDSKVKHYMERLTRIVICCVGTGVVWIIIVWNIWLFGTPS